MTDLHDRFRTLDRVRTPDLWSEVTHRATAPRPRAWGLATMNPAIGIAVAVTAAVVALVGVGVLLGPRNIGTPVASPTASASPDATIPTLTDEDALDPGTYRIDLDRVLGGADEYPSVVITVPDGWHHREWLVNRPRSGHDIPPVSIQFWDVQLIYGHPCQWKGTTFLPGPTTDDLADALVDVPLRNASDPTDVTLGGYSGRYLEWSVPADQEFDADGAAVGCDADIDVRIPEFRSWLGRDTSTRYQQGPGQVDRLWIMDLDGTRLVIDAFSMPYATAEERAELTEVIESIRFEP